SLHGPPLLLSRYFKREEWLLREGVVKPEVHPSQHLETLLFKKLFHGRLQLCSDIAYLFIVLEDIRDFRNPHLRYDKPQTGPHEPAAMELPEPDLPEHVFFIPLHTTPICLEGHFIISLFLDLFSNLIKDIGNITAFGRNRCYLDDDLGLISSGKTDARRC